METTAKAPGLVAKTHICDAADHPLGKTPQITKRVLAKRVDRIRVDWDYSGYIAVIKISITIND
jgi:hypothetical protein